VWTWTEDGVNRTLMTNRIRYLLSRTSAPSLPNVSSQSGRTKAGPPTSGRTSWGPCGSRG